MRGGLSIGGLAGHLHDDGRSIMMIVCVLPHYFLPKTFLLSLAVTITGDYDDDGHSEYSSHNCTGDDPRLCLVVVVVAVTRGIHAVPPIVAAVKAAVLIVTLGVVAHRDKYIP